MAAESILIWMDALAFLLLAVALKFLIKNREFERQEVENSLNAVLFGVFFLFLVFLLYLVIDIEALYHGALASFVPNSATYAGYLTFIVDLGLLPLFAICFFVGIFLAREHLKDYPLAVEQPKTKPRKNTIDRFL